MTACLRFDWSAKDWVSREEKMKTRVGREGRRGTRAWVEDGREVGGRERVHT